MAQSSSGATAGEGDQLGFRACFLPKVLFFFWDNESYFWSCLALVFFQVMFSIGVLIGVYRVFEEYVSLLNWHVYNTLLMRMMRMMLEVLLPALRQSLVSPLPRLSVVMMILWDALCKAVFVHSLVAGCSPKQLPWELKVSKPPILRFRLLVFGGVTPLPSHINFRHMQSSNGENLKILS